VERFEGGLELRGLGPEFQRSLYLEGGNWEGSFILGR